MSENDWQIMAKIIAETADLIKHLSISEMFNLWVEKYPEHYQTIENYYFVTTIRPALAK